MLAAPGSGTAGNADAAHHDPNDDEDAAWLLAYARDGDIAAFERLYRRHERPMFRFLLRASGERELAEDLLAETWLAVCRQAGGFRSGLGARCRTWLYTIAHHKLMDHLRRHARERQAATALATDAAVTAGRGFDDEPGLEAQLQADARDEPLALLERRECARALLAALQALPAEQREAWLLQAEGGLSLEQIASATDVGIETAKSRLRYARAKLRLQLARWSPDDTLGCAALS